MGWRFVLSLVFALVVAVFAIQNAGAVPINFLVWEGAVSQALIIIMSAIVGAVIVLLLSLIKQIQLNLAVKSERKTGSVLQEEKKTLQEEKKALQARLDQATEQLTQLTSAMEAMSQDTGE